MRIPLTKESLPMAGALLAAAVAGGAVAIVGAALVGVGDSTTTVREVLLDRPALSGNISQQGSDRRLTVRDIYRKDAPGVVQVTSTTKVKLPRSQWFGNPFGLQGTDVQQSLGSGFVIDKSGLVVTNYHVVGDARTVYVSFSNSDSMRAEIVGRDASTDVALLKVIASSRALKPLRLGDSDAVQVGDEVAAIGNPLGYERSITLGIVSALHRSLTSPGGAPIDRVIQTDAVLNRGNSGGPLLNAHGRVLGINAQIKSQSGGGEGVGFAIPVDAVSRSLRELRANGKVGYGYLGVQTLSLWPQLAERLDLDVEDGALIQDIESDSPAEKAGLKEGDDEIGFQATRVRTGGDVIVAVDGRRLSRSDDLADEISAMSAGDEVELELVRDGQHKTVRVRLGERPRGSG